MSASGHPTPDSNVLADLKRAFDAAQFDRALALCRTLNAGPSATRYTLNIEARCLHQLGRNDEAVRLIKCRSDLLTDSSDAWATLAHAFEALGRDEEHLAALREACRLGPTPDRLVLLGVAHAHRGDLSAAESALRQALDIQPDHSEAKANLAHFIIPHTDLPMKATLLREAVEHDPENGFAWERLGILLSLNEATLAEAVAALERALVLRSDAHIARAQLADALWRRGAIDQARRNFWILADQTDPWLASRTGEFFAASGEADIAERIYLRSLEVIEHAEVLWRYGVLLRATGRGSLAAEILRRASRLAPDDVRIATELMACDHETT